MAVTTHAERSFVSADTASITLQEAEKSFLNDNLQLLASHYNVSASRAAIIQASLWNNPNIEIEQNVYNKFTGRYFDYTKTGNTEVQLQQLFLLAGKREKQIRLAEAGSQIEEYNFYDLLRLLTYRLRHDFFDLFFLQQSVRFYNETIPRVEQTVGAAETMYKSRSILLSEVLRLQSLLFSLETERLKIFDQIDDLQGDFHILLHDTASTQMYYMPVLASKPVDSLYVDSLSLPSVVALALDCRPDFQIAKAQVQYEEANLSLQKSLAVPDLTVGGRYSRAGSYIPDYYAITFSIDLPFFNRNQGNIESSVQTMESDKQTEENVKETIETEASTAYRKALDAEHVLERFDKNLSGQYDTLVEGMIANYRSRNINSIEFTDFFESYRTSMLQMIQLEDDRIDAIEGLNCAVGKNIINFY